MDCVPTTFSYGVSGGTGYSSPDVNFTYGGWAAQAPLTTVPSPYYMDPGSNWQVAQVLPGSDGSQRWATSGAVSGGAGSSPVALEYYQQYSLQLSLSVAGGDERMRSNRMTTTLPLGRGRIRGRPISSRFYLMYGPNVSVLSRLLGGSIRCPAFGGECGLQERESLVLSLYSCPRSLRA